MTRPQQQAWEECQTWERNWWLNNPEMYPVEIQKGDIVGGWLGIRDMPTASVVDIGCGPFSLLQRVKVGTGYAVDPIDYGPLEIGYQIAGISRVLCRGEELTLYLGNTRFDEAWIYNCLQHVEDPQEILRQATQIAKRVRLFEWINIPAYTGHLQMLTLEGLIRPFREAGWLPDFQCVGTADFDGLNGEFFVGVFRDREVT